MAQKKTPPPEKKTWRSLNLAVLCTRGICAWLESICYEDADMEKRIRQQMVTNTKLAVLQKWKDFSEGEKAVTKIQSLYRKWKARKEYRLKKKAAFRIQLAFRIWKTERDFRRLMTEENPPLTLVRNFCHLLKPAEITVQEIELNMLKSQAASNMKATQQQRQELSAIQEDIAALLEGHLALRDLATTFKKLKSSNRDNVIQAMTSKTQQTCQLRQRQQVMAAYEQLFFHLQTEPRYLSRLICCLFTHYQAIQMADRLLVTLYNRASTPREEYHLMRLLEDALHMEIQSKGVPSIPQGELMSLTTINRLYLKDTKYRSLIQALKPAIQEILNVNAMLIPNGDELSSRGSKIVQGVKRLLLHFTAKAPVPDKHCLFFMADQVVKCIVSSVHCIPYGIRYMARVIHQSVQETIPAAGEDTVLRTVGTFLYHYLQPAIEDPHVFGLIAPDMYADSVQQMNLTAVSKLIGIAINPFQSKRDYVPEVRDYITRNTPRLRSFVREVINVLDPEEYLGFNKFSDATTFMKPVINISAEDIIYTHDLLAKHEHVIFPDHTDEVYQLMKSIGPIPHIKDLLGVAAAREERPEICLRLSGKSQPLEDFDGEMENLATTTQKLILDVIRVQPGETLHEVLTTPASPSQREKHMTLMGKTNVTNASMNTASHFTKGHFLTLKEKKGQIQTNLEVLQRAGLVPVTMDYDSILNTVSKQLKLKYEQREQRKREIAVLRQTIGDLSALSKELQDHIDLYKTYRESAVTYLVYQRSHNDGEVQRIIFAEDEIQYTAKELVRKGVIVKTWGSRKTLKREVLTLKLNGGSVLVQLRSACELLPVVELLKRHNSSDPIMQLLHYDVDARLLLFLLYTQLFMKQTLITPPAALPINIRREPSIPSSVTP